tara:strand:+ start:1512 stop:1679 length:168 start_codon:yes stop_codon:yes gene_type:complete
MAGDISLLPGKLNHIEQNKLNPKENTNALAKGEEKKLLIKNDKSKPIARYINQTK